MARRISRIIERDRGWKKFKREMRKTNKARVRVGVLTADGSQTKRVKTVGGKKAPRDLPNLATVALWQEFGTYTKDGSVWVPERSFIRSTFDENRFRLRQLQIGLAKKIGLTMDIETALAILGQWMKALQIKKINDLRTPPNDPVTIKRKGSSNPLIATAQMKQSIHYKTEVPLGQEVIQG